MKKLLATVAVLTGTVAGSVGGYYYHEAESSPAFLSLSAAYEIVTGREAKAQAAYEAAQSKLAVLQEEVQAQEERHRQQLAVVHGRRQRAELTLRSALTESNRKVALAESVTIPPPVIIPNDPEARLLDGDPSRCRLGAAGRDSARCHCGPPGGAGALARHQQGLDARSR